MEAGKNVIAQIYNYLQSLYIALKTGSSFNLNLTS